MLVSAQPLTPFCHKNGKWGYEGYVKGKTKAVIKPKFESARKFQGSYAFVSYKGLWGIIGKDGKFVVKPKYNYVGEQKEDYSIVKLGDRYGIIKGTQVVVPFKYDELRFFGDSYAYVRMDRKWGVIELSGREIVPAKYDKIYKFEDHYLKVCVGDKYGLYSLSGNRVVGDQYDDISLYAGKFFKVKQGNKFGLLNLYGKQIATVQYDDISLYERNFLKVKQGDKYGLLNLAGEQLATVQYDDISLYERNFLKVKQGDKFGLLNLAGEQLAAVQYDAISLYENQFFKVKQNGKYGLLDMSGTSVVPVQYNDISLYKSKYLKVKQGNKLGLFSISGVSLASVEYDDISLVDNQFLKVRKGRRYGLLSVNGTSIAEVKYDAIALLDNKYISVKVDWKYGLLDLQGNMLIATEYDSIKKISKDKYLLMSDTPCLVDTRGNIYRNLMLYTSSDGNIIKPRYTSCFDANIILNAYCGNIGVMAFDKQLTKITNGAFRYCNTLTDITIPESVTTVEGDIFYGCSSLPVEDGFRYAGTYLVERVDKTLQTYIIKPGTRFIGDDALDFSYEENKWLNMSCENRSLTAPDTIIFVGKTGSLCCVISLNIIITDLKRHCESPISLIDGVNGDGDASPVQLYMNGEVIEDLVIPDGVKKIASMSFGSCWHINSITIPSSVKEVESYAFYFNCIPVIYCKHTVPPTGFSPYSFYGELDDGPDPNYFKIYVPRKSVNAYKQAKNWKRFAPGIIGYDFNTTKQVSANKPLPPSER